MFHGRGLEPTKTHNNLLWWIRASVTGRKGSRGFTGVDVTLGGFKQPQTQLVRSRAASRGSSPCCQAVVAPLLTQHRTRASSWLQLRRNPGKVLTPQGHSAGNQRTTSLPNTAPFVLALVPRKGPEGRPMVLYSPGDALLLLHAARAPPFPSRHSYNVVNQHLRMLLPEDLT